MEAFPRTNSWKRTCFSKSIRIQGGLKMTNQTIEQKLPELNWVYVAKELAPHLELSIPQPSKVHRKEKLFTDYVMDAVGYMMLACTGGKGLDRPEEEKQRIKELNDARDAEDERFYAKNGLMTATEKEAFSFAHFTGLCLGRQADYLAEGKESELTPVRF